LRAGQRERGAAGSSVPEDSREQYKTASRPGCPADIDVDTTV
jgi:hypothetical protein